MLTDRYIFKKAIGDRLFYFSGVKYFIPGSLLLLGWLTVFRFPPWLSFHSEWSAIVGGIYLFYLLKSSENEEFSVFTSGALVLVSLLLAGFGFLTGAWVFVLYVGLFTTIVVFLAHSKSVKAVSLAFFQIIVLGGLTTALIAFAQYFDTVDRWLGWMSRLPPGSDRAYGNLGQPNQAATLLLMAWAALTVLFEEGRLRSWAWWLGSALLWAVVVFTQSRTGMLSMAVMVVCGVWATAKLRVGQPVRGMTVGRWCLSLVVFAGMVWAMFAGQSSFTDKVYRGDLTSSNGRWVIWQQIWRGIEASPWWGYGPLQTAAAQRVGAESVSGTSHVAYAHNLVLDLMAWFGIPVALLLVGAGLWWAWKTWRTNPTYPASRPLLVLVPFAVHSMLEMPYSYAYLLFPVAILLGIWARMAKDSVQLKASTVVASADARAPVGWGHRLQSSWMWLLLVGWTALGGAIVRDYLLAEEDFRVVRFEILRVGRTPPDYQQPKMWVLTQFDDVLSGARVKPRPGQSPEDIAKLQRAVRHFPWAPLDSRLVASLALNGREPEALAHLRMLKNYYAPSIYDSIISYLKLQAQSHKPLEEFLQKSSQ